MAVAAATAAPRVAAVALFLHVSAVGVILISVDTLRADRLGCYGREPSFTPAIDAFCAGLEVERPVDHEIANGVYPDMTEHGWESDDWPEIYDKVKAADILVITSPIWLGEKSMFCWAKMGRENLR